MQVAFVNLMLSQPLSQFISFQRFHASEDQLAPQTFHQGIISPFACLRQISEPGPDVDLLYQSCRRLQLKCVRSLQSYRYEHIPDEKDRRTFSRPKGLAKRQRPYLGRFRHTITVVAT